MKLRKFISLTITSAMVASTAAALSMPTASAATPRPEVNDENNYSDTFDSYGNQTYQNTLSGLKNYGWYMADHTQLYTDVATVAPYSTFQYKLAKIQDKYLYITSAGESKTNNARNYGYGKSFPGVDADGAAEGVWEISFDIYPNGTEFAVTLNTADGSAGNTTNAQHTIIAQYGDNFYLGYRNYMTLYNNSNPIPQGKLPIGSVGGKTWYSVKTILNCDARYYSVELYNRSTGKLIARRSPISFAGNETIGFLKFSALGISTVSTIGIDNVSIKKTESDNLIYGEDFESFTVDSSYSATGGVSTSSDATGDSYFEGYTPWRAYSNANGYSIVAENGNKTVKLGKVSDSSLVYMPYGDKLVDSAVTQANRGMVKTSFKIKPESIGNDGASVNVIADYAQVITDNNSVAFEISKNGDVPAVVIDDDNSVNLDADKWYDVELGFDVQNHAATTIVKDGNTVVASFFRPVSYLTAVKGIIFKVPSSSTILMDDVIIEYGSFASTKGAYKFVNSKYVNAGLSDLTLNPPITVAVDYKNLTVENMPAELFIAYYSNDGRFLGYQHKHDDSALTAGKSGTLRISITDSPHLSDTPAYAKLYLWDGTKNITPYCVPITISQ